MTFRARVRGIYSTALTKLLLDEGFEIVQPSPAIRERFKLDESMKTPDIDIYDRHNRQGVHVIATAESISAFKTLLLKHFFDVIFRKQPLPVDGIYKGIVREDEGEGHFVSVDIGSTVGKLPRNELDTSEPGTVMVQVQRSQTLGKPLLSTRINIAGEQAIIIPERKVKVSLKVRDMQTRMSLIRLGENLVSSEWGIIWRTSAAHQPSEVLEEEVKRLAKVREEVLKKAEQETAPALLWGTRYYVNVEFPALSKAALDEARAQVAPTIKGHHYYKACGSTVSATLEMAEKMLEDNALREEVERVFLQTVEASYLVEGSFVSIEHVKPDGKVYHLGKAMIERRCGDELRYLRVFKSDGFYDSLGTPKETGDHAITEATIGGWHYTTRYFSKDGVYKGAHVNLHTPLELYPRWIRYVDLEVDICALPDGTVKIVDEDKLEEAVAHGFISEKLSAIVKEKAAKIRESLMDMPSAR